MTAVYAVLLSVDGRRMSIQAVYDNQEAAEADCRYSNERRVYERAVYEWRVLQVRKEFEGGPRDG